MASFLLQAGTRVEIGYKITNGGVLKGTYTPLDGIAIPALTLIDTRGVDNASVFFKVNYSGVLKIAWDANAPGTDKLDLTINVVEYFSQHFLLTNDYVVTLELEI